MRRTSSYRLPAAVVVFAFASAFARPAKAESAADKAAADALFNDARKLIAQKKYDDACPKFAESMRLSGRLGTLLNLATCHEHQGKTASAWAEFNQAVALAKTQHDKKREKYATSHAQKLEKRLARLSLSPPEGSKYATLFLDGKEMGASVWDTPLPLDPGSHEVEVRVPGKKSWSTTVEVKEGPETTKLAVPALEAEAPPESEKPEAAAEAKPEPAPRTPAEARGGSHALGWVSLGVGVVGVGVGSYFGLRTFSKKNEASDHCGANIGQSNDTLCDAQGVDLRNQAHTAATVSTVSFAVGAVGLGAGIVLLLSGSSSEKSARRSYVAPSVGPGGAGVTLGGIF
jgi:hypothetical protein